MEQLEFDGFLGPKPIEKGKKFDDDKLRYELLPTQPLQEIVKVLTEGARKYGARNWEQGIEWSRVYGALQRHLMAFWEGEDKDPESGFSHLAHAGCNVLFLLFFSHHFKNLDDRPLWGKHGKKKTIRAFSSSNDKISLPNLALSKSGRRQTSTKPVTVNP